MIDIEHIFDIGPFDLNKNKKRSLILDHINKLNSHHIAGCEPYKKILKAYGKNRNNKIKNISDFQYIPVNLFKEIELKSTVDSSIIKTLTSSGTTSGTVSKIFLDRDTSRYQTKALAKIIQEFVGPKRLPMLIIDSDNVIKDRKLFSARGAGILGMANFGRNHLYVLDNNFNLKTDALMEFADKYAKEKILIFGFTFIILLHLYEKLKKNKLNIDLENAVMIHSGGWKKLVDRNIDNESFKKGLEEISGIRNIHNFYGMVEQIGSIYMECECGYFHTTTFSDIIIRNPDDWSPMNFGEEGVVETLSILPYSYPGHVLLTEDIGTVYGEDDCKCGRLGKYFKILGRIPKAEIRGCSDTYEE